MIANGKHYDTNDYFVPIEGAGGRWKCIIQGCPSAVKAEGKPGHLKWVHHEMFGLDAPPKAPVTGRKSLKKYSRETLVRAYNNIPEVHTKLEVHPDV